ncbi:hypothetical protein ACFRR7_34825 [Streptomyces sp. NPDC056909]|uniref:hypothetical protein n=1 Tax=Streptomyces sp. NPDC056909 TaxID=3345963 RepID=UPI00367882E4
MSQPTTNNAVSESTATTVVQAGAAGPIHTGAGEQITSTTNVVIRGNGATVINDASRAVINQTFNK